MKSHSHEDRLSRRGLFKTGTKMAAALGVMDGIDLTAKPTPTTSTASNIYQKIGVRPIINCRGTYTIISGSLSLPEVKQAMEEASKHYVHMDELMDGVGARLAQLTGAPWGIVTAGCAAAMTGMTSACIAGTDPEKMQKLPYLAGLKSEVIIPDYSRNVYDHAIRMLGVKVVQVRTKAEYEAAFNERTAMVYILAGPGDDGPMGTEALSAIARQKNVPLMVDAAAEMLTIPNLHLGRGATVVGYSGGKCLRGPQCAGLLLGDKNLLQAAWANAAPHHAFARSLKVGKEEIMGMLTAVEMWNKRDHKAEWAQWQSWLDHIQTQVTKIDGVTTSVIQPESLSNRAPVLKIQWDAAKLGITGQEVDHILYNTEPRVTMLSPHGKRPDMMQSSVSVMPYMMMPGDEKIAAERLYAVLSKPPKFENPPVPQGPLAEVSGIWEAEVEFTRGTGNHTLYLEQTQSELKGEHRGEFLTADLHGSVVANEVQFRAVHRYEGTELFYTFSGKADGDTMSGTVNLGEYGEARWQAHRHSYKS
jgi:D-glucosaminate-6-phosphate ammonia-lyase